MTTRIEVSDRAKVVVDHHSTGQTYLSIRIDGAAFGVMLGEADRERLSEALRLPCVFQSSNCDSPGRTRARS
jgi:hypothetical protein